MEKETEEQYAASLSAAPYLMWNDQTTAREKKKTTSTDGFALQKLNFSAVTHQTGIIKRKIV